MLDLLQTLGAFILTLGLLITAHEWGHYWVAKRLGIKILRFSVGFGWPLWSRRFGSDQTEFVVAALPLGGYVKMLDEAEAEVAEGERHRAFNRQPLRVRAAVVVAGPLANFVFAVLAFSAMHLWGVQGIKPLVGTVDVGSIAAEAGFESGQLILEVNGKPVRRWASVMEEVLEGVAYDRPLQFLVRDPADQYSQTLWVKVDGAWLNEMNKVSLFHKLGLTPYYPPLPAVVDSVSPDGAAAAGGLQAGDEILAVDGEAVSDWNAWAERIQASPGQLMQTQVRRGERVLSLNLTPRERDGSGYLGVGAQRPPLPAEYLSLERHGPFQSLLLGLEKTWDTTALTLRLLGKMLTLQVSLENLNGPVSIAQYAGYTLAAGTATFLAFLGLLNVSLGVLNLLPIPVLDGGHLLVYLLEWLKGKPLSEDSLFLLQRIGLTVLLLLMGIAFFNDLNRLWG